MASDYYRHLRLLLFLVLGFFCSFASAALTCEQLAEIAYTTQQLRDQGNSLVLVLAEAEKLEATNKFTAAEVEIIKLIVEQSFKSIRSPSEVLQTCRDGQRR